MAENWWTLYEIATGVCRAHTSVLPQSIDPLLAVVDHGSARQDQTKRWNTTTRAWDITIPAPVTVDRLQDLVNHPYLADVWTRLTVAQRTKLRKTVVWLLATRRRRGQTEDVPLEPDESWPTDPSLAVE